MGRIDRPDGPPRLSWCERRGDCRRGRARRWAARGRPGHARAQDHATGRAAQADPGPHRRQVTILNLGTWQSPGGDRLLRFAWANGVRYFDTAKSYGSEPMIGRWLQAMPGGPQGPVPGHQGRASNAPPAHRAARPAARGAPDRLCRPVLRPRPGRHQFRVRAAVAQEPGVQAGRRRDPQVGQGEVRRLLDPSPAQGLSCSRPRRRAGSSTRSCCRTTPGSPRKTT